MDLIEPQLGSGGHCGPQPEGHGRDGDGMTRRQLRIPAAPGWPLGYGQRLARGLLGHEYDHMPAGERGGRVRIAGNDSTDVEPAALDDCSCALNGV